MAEKHLRCSYLFDEPDTAVRFGEALRNHLADEGIACRVGVTGYRPERHTVSGMAMTVFEG